jgi:hypothetical protein
MKRTITLLLAAMVCCLCSVSAQKSAPKNYQKKYQLKGQTQWTDNQHIDKEQIRNLDWREYQYWLEHVFGADSKEYKASIPDRKVINQQLPEKIAEVYLQSVAYALYPVLGISNEQAEAYCKWRTDRVAEQMLVSMKRIEYNPNQTKDNYFRLENYKADDGLQFQRFSLPTKKNETRYGFRCVSVWE